MRIVIYAVLRCAMAYVALSLASTGKLSWIYTSDDKPDSNKVVLGYERMDIIYSKQQGGITLALMIIVVS